MKGFENFTENQRNMISEYAEFVPSVRVEISPSGRKTYVIGTYEDDYRFSTKKDFLEAIESTLAEWRKENGND